jgi:hypothetical protein
MTPIREDAMTSATHFTAAKTSDSSVRNVALAAPRAVTASQSQKPVAGRPGAARRFLDALVRSLAAVHS